MSRILARNLSVILAILVLGCNLSAPRTTPIPDSQVVSTGTQAPLSTASSTTATNSIHNAGGMAIRFLDLADGSTVTASLDEKGQARAMIQVEVTGEAPFLVQLTADGILNAGLDGHPVETRNPEKAVPFRAQIPWYPPHGGGTYTLEASAFSDQKQEVKTSIRVTVTGVAAFTALPPALSRAEAAGKFASEVMGKYAVNIPAPSLQRFDFPVMPARSRWIGSAFYRGMFYYLQMFADNHEEWFVEKYAEPAHLSHDGSFVLCRPSGTYRVLVVFVDYGNTGATADAARAQVPVVVDWLNGLYAAWATSQGFSAPLMHINAETAYIPAPPSSGALLTADQIRSGTGKDPAAYDIRMQIDLDKNATTDSHVFQGVITEGGGVALQGCSDAGKYGVINIYSNIPDNQIAGGLVMDFNHELSHLFGMQDDWPYNLQAAGPDGSTVSDWIPYAMFGWTDADGDGIPEIIDPTPYGTTGPQP